MSLLWTQVLFVNPGEEEMAIPLCILWNIYVTTEDVLVVFWHLQIGWNCIEDYFFLPPGSGQVASICLKCLPWYPTYFHGHRVLFGYLGQHKELKAPSLHPPPSINSHMVEYKVADHLGLSPCDCSCPFICSLLFIKICSSHFLYYTSFTWFTWETHVHPSRLGSSVSSERLLVILHPFQNQHPSLCAPTTLALSPV